MVVFPSEAAVSQKFLGLFFCSAYWKEIISNLDESCQQHADDASTYKTTPKCQTTFTNTLFLIIKSPEI